MMNNTFDTCWRQVDITICVDCFQNINKCYYYLLFTVTIICLDSSSTPKKKKRIRHSIKGLGSHYPMISNCHQESLSFLFGHVKLHRFFKQSFILDMSDHHTNLFLTAKLKSSIAKVSLENRTNFPV